MLIWQFLVFYSGTTRKFNYRLIELKPFRHSCVVCTGFSPFGFHCLVKPSRRNFCAKNHILRVNIAKSGKYVTCVLKIDSIHCNVRATGQITNRSPWLAFQINRFVSHENWTNQFSIGIFFDFRLLGLRCKTTHSFDGHVIIIRWAHWVWHISKNNV